MKINKVTSVETRNERKPDLPGECEDMKMFVNLINRRVISHTFELRTIS
jgi:hypothetical protein